ncbi:MAG: hypothetical protein US82_C0042G0004 [Parcubacteria group bacterium GW2011_GWC1_38_22]|nr:MAG: hypothetical protein US82_C0042G0004 [Parcubacteria group bacterium GW2011_GWC1_38_22]
MTKYVLNSGRAMTSADKGRKFFDEIFKGLGENPKFLICYFAKAREKWEENFAKDEQYFREVFSDINPILTLAFPDQFEEQIKESDAIFIHGGDDHLIQFWLKQFDLPKIWEGKVVAGSSAGSDVLSKHFWTCDWRQCLDGLGILPIKFLAHYKSEYGINDPRGAVDWENGHKELEKYGDGGLPIYALKEGEFEIFEV